MTTIVAGEREPAQRLADELSDGDGARVLAPGPPSAPDPPGSSAPLARALVACEAELLDQQGARVLLADDSDFALASLLVATKLLLHVAASDDARAPSTANGRVIAQLAEAYTRPA